MNAAVNLVKAPSGSPRKQRALATRLRILGAAYTLFCANGYAATTMGAIADAAGVAVQTLPFTFHTKAELLIAVWEMQAAGEDRPKPVLERPGMRAAFDAEDPFRSLALAVEHGTDIYARVAPLAATIAAAASVDEVVAAAREAVAKQRRSGMGKMVERLAASGRLAAGLSAGRATDLLVVLFSHETFLGLTVGCGWTVPAYKAWLYETLCTQLLVNQPVAKLLKAAAGLTYERALDTMLKPMTKRPRVRPQAR